MQTALPAWLALGQAGRGKDVGSAVGTSGTARIVGLEDEGGGTGETLIVAGTGAVETSAITCLTCLRRQVFILPLWTFHCTFGSIFDIISDEEGSNIATGTITGSITTSQTVGITFLALITGGRIVPIGTSCETTVLVQLQWRRARGALRG